MTLREYQDAALRTAPRDVTPYHDLMHGAMGVATESGELLDVLKKGWAYHKPIDHVNIKEEMGDLLWYLALLARATGTNLDQIAATNVAKLKARYPEKFTNEQALHRNLGAERAVLESHSV